MPQPKVNIANSGGELVGVTGNALDVHLKTGTSTIDIGDVEILGHSGTVYNVSKVVADSVTQLAATTGGCKHVDIMSSVGNTGIIYIGGSNVTAARGIALYPGDVYSVDVSDTNILYAVAVVDTETLQIVTYN